MTEHHPHHGDETESTRHGRVAAPEQEPEDEADQRQPEQEGTREDVGEERGHSPPRRAAPPALAAEALALAGAALSGIALLGSRTVEVLSSVLATDQLGAITNTIIGDGILAFAGLLLGAIALLRANATTQPWGRWLATAAVIIGLVGVVAALTAYPLVPAPQAPLVP